MKINKNEKLNVMMIIEVLGRPPEHLTETLNDIIKKINKEKGVEVKEKKVNEPIVMKDNEQFYTNFAEIEVEIMGVALLAEIMFKYMPAHIEIISPENLEITNNNLNEIFNSLMRRLHGLDDVTRIVQNEKIILERKLKALTEGKDDSKEQK